MENSSREVDLTLKVTVAHLVRFAPLFDTYVMHATLPTNKNGNSLQCHLQFTNEV